MEMTADEIRVRYRQAKSPNEQIKILAELNDCPIGDIAEILGKKYMDKKDRYSEIERLYNEGMTDSEISKQLLCPCKNVYFWRVRNDKPSNSRRRKKIEQYTVVTSS